MQTLARVFDSFLVGSSDKGTLILLFIRWTAFIASTALVGCQSPVVAKRDYSYTVVFTVDGESYRAALDWSCFHEKANWINMGDDSAAWHPRMIEGVKNGFRAMGELRDGSRFEVLPVNFSEDYAYKPCPADGLSLKSAVFIQDAGDPQRVTEFDDMRSKNHAHKVHILESKVTLNASGLSTFTDSNYWPTAAIAKSYFYSITMTIYAASLWSKDIHVSDFVKQRKIDWISKNGTYPATIETNGDGDFAGTFIVYVERSPSFVPPEPRYLTPTADSWIADDRAFATDWISGSGRGVAWVTYEGSKIEIPLDRGIRFVFDSSRNEVIGFRVERVALW